MAGLTPLQELFVAHYCETWNATEAAERAGYKGTRAALGVTGHDNLKNPKIAEAIQQHIEAIMPAGEVLQALAEIARGSMEDIIDADTGTVDLWKAAKNKKMHLIRKFTRSDSESGSRVSVELYSRKDALELLGKHHGLFKDVIDIRFDASQMTDDQLRRIAAGEDPQAVLRG